MKCWRRFDERRMHELSVAQALLDQIEAVAQPRGAIRIPSATIRVGPLSGVEPELLSRAFDVARLARAGTANTVLTLQIGEICVSCSTCGREGPAAVNDLSCRYCASVRTRLRAGDELLLLHVELDVPAAGAGPENGIGDGHV